MIKAAVFASLLLLTACGSDSACDPTAPNTICTIAGNGEQGLSGDKGQAVDASFYVPQDTVISPAGELWIIDFNNYLLRAIDADGIIRTVGGNGELGDSPPIGTPTMPVTDAPFNHTTNMVFHDGFLYLAAWHNSRVKRVNMSTDMLENYAGAGKRLFYYGDEMDALDAAVDLPAAVAVDPRGNIAIMDSANQVIRTIDENHVIHRIAGQCIVEDTTTCAPGQEPTQCPGSDKTTCGDLTTECDKPCSPGFAGDGGPALSMRQAQGYGQMTDPTGRMMYDSAGNLFFADTDNNRIRKIDTAGIVTTVAGTGETGSSGDNVPATQAQLNHPVDIATADDGVYFSDVQNNCIRKIDTAGIIHTVAGQCSNDPADRGFEGDGGDPLKAKLNRPYGIDVVGKTLYVTDSYNNRVRRVNLP
ncbi:MAG TPA: hypothetical protein VGM90_31325 [Kofleriaceae bacterium]|jgi:hypothetical protein